MEGWPPGEGRARLGRPRAWTVSPKVSSIMLATLGTLWSVRRGFCLDMASSPRHTLAGSDRMMLPFPEEGGQHLPAHTSTVAAPVQSWGSSGTFGQARRSQSQHSRHPGLENSLLWGLTCALLYVSLSLWPQPTDASSTIPPSLSKL